MSHRDTRNTGSTYVRMEVSKILDYWFAHEFGKEIFFLYHEINNLEFEFWVKNMLVATYSRAVIT